MAPCPGAHGRETADCIGQGSLIRDDCSQDFVLCDTDQFCQRTRIIHLAPISCFWALGWTVSLGLLRPTQTLKNLEKRPDCIINLPTSAMWQEVERLAPLTGQNPVPSEKRSQLRYDPNKFPPVHFIPVASKTVAAAPAKECPVHLGAVLRKVLMLDGDARLGTLGGGAAVEVEITRMDVRKDLIIKQNYIAAERWEFGARSWGKPFAQRCGFLASAAPNTSGSAKVS